MTGINGKKASQLPCALSHIIVGQQGARPLIIRFRLPGFHWRFRHVANRLPPLGMACLAVRGVRVTLAKGTGMIPVPAGALASPPLHATFSPEPGTLERSGDLLALAPRLPRPDGDACSLRWFQRRRFLARHFRVHLGCAAERAGAG